MDESTPKHKILVAVDGSQQSVKAIRYAANVFPPDRTRIVLFNIQEQLFNLFSDLVPYPYYSRRVTGLKHWATEQKQEIINTMDSAAAYFRQKGFPESAVCKKIPAKNLGIVQDIIKESYNGYQAIVLGNSGWSRFKDWLLKSTAVKLVAKTKHIPIIVVGGNPDTQNLLLAFDGTHGAMKSVACVGALMGSSNQQVQLYSMISKEKKFWAKEERYFTVRNMEEPIETGSHRLGPLLAEARNRLLAEGMEPRRLSIKIEAVEREQAAPRIVQEAKQNGFGSIAVGRRGMISFFDAYIIGRVSDQVLKLADELAVWVI